MVLEYLLKWLKIFNVAKIHISDSGSRLQTPDISEANRLFGTDHHFRTGYCVKARKQFRGFTRKFSRCWQVFSEFKQTWCKRNALMEKHQLQQLWGFLHSIQSTCKTSQLKFQWCQSSLKMTRTRSKVDELGGGLYRDNVRHSPAKALKIFTSLNWNRVQKKENRRTVESKVSLQERVSNHVSWKHPGWWPLSIALWFPLHEKA